MEGRAEGVSPSAGDGKAEVELLNSSDWDYDAYLGMIKGWLDKSATGKDRERVRNLLTACVKVTQNAEFNSNTDIQRKGEASEGTTSGKDVEHGVTASSRNPLEIDLVLRRVLGFLPVNTLLTCRLVSHTWNFYATSFLRQKKRNRVNVKFDQFRRFWSDFKNAEVFPLTKLGITLHNVSLEVFSSFFTKHGYQIHDLKIQEVASRPRSRYSEKMFLEDIRKLKFILRHVPNLKALSLNCTELFWMFSKSAYKDTELLKIPLKQVESFEFVTSAPLGMEVLNGLFAMLPNVKVVRLSLGQRMKNYELLDEALQKLTLREIFVSSSNISRNPLWNSIASSQKLKVISFAFGLFYPDLGYAEVENMLTSQSECLETLILTKHNSFIFNDNSDNHSRLRLPILKNLKCLEFKVEIEDGVHDPTWDPAIRLPLVPIKPEQVPALKTVVFSTDILDYPSVFSDSTFPTVEELRGRGRVGSVLENYNMLTHVSKVFPNLRKVTNLASILSPHAINTAAGIFKNVEELEWEVLGDAYEKTDFNYFISGLPWNAEWLLSQLTERFGMEAILSSIDTPRMSIFNFERLTSLKLKLTGNGALDRFCINEIGVHMGFLRLSPQVRVTLEGEFTIRSDLAALLTSHFQNIYFCPQPKENSNVYQRGLPI